MTTIASRTLSWFEPARMLKYSLVGASGYLVNLAAFASLVHGAELDLRAAATCSFFLSATNNYLWNRGWTFRDRSGKVTSQAGRFLLVSLLTYGASLGLLSALVATGLAALGAQALAIVLATPLGFSGNKAWSFRALTRPSDLHLASVKVRRTPHLLAVHESTARSRR